MRFVFVACIAALALASAPAFAESESSDAAKDFFTKLKAAQKDPDRAGLVSVVESAADLHNGLEDAGNRKKIQAALGKVLRDKKAGRARSSAAVALGQLDDPKGAWKQLSKGLPTPKSKEAGPAEIQALKAVAVHAPETAIAPLLKLMTKGKSYDAARESITALGRYSKSKKRVQILKEMLDVMSRHHAAAEAAKQNPKGGSGDRAWQELGEPLIAALNQLTGKKHPGAVEWLAAYKAHKKKLGGLFPASP